LICLPYSMTRAALLLSVLLLLSSIVVSTSVTAEENDRRDPPTVKIGFLIPITGPVAMYGPGWSAAGDIAEEHINAMQSQYNFEIVVADSGCDGTTAESAAQSLVAAGVVAVAGAACSGASMGANSVLSTYGIPQVSYASTYPGLSDDSAYSGFMRVVPSDAQLGQAISYAMNQTGDSYPAMIHETGDYGSSTADAFEDAYGSSNICSTMSYVDTESHTPAEFYEEVDSLMNDGCDSVVMVSYPMDGANLVEALRDKGFTGSIVGGDGITTTDWLDEFTDPTEATGVNAVKPASGSQTNLRTAFETECNADSDCSGGIYTNEAYDSIRIIADAYVNRTSYSSLEQAILDTGTNWEGASGYLTFLPNGDAIGNGYDICEYISQHPQLSPDLICDEVWQLGGHDSDGDGWTDADESDCSTDPDDANSIPEDWDSDGVCDLIDSDDDNDGYPDDSDWAPHDSTEWIDTDGDGIGNNADFDDDGDSWADIREVECGYDPLSASSTPSDFDSDNECDELDYDDDNDGYPDTDDWAPMDSSEWLDTDNDGVGNNADSDDDDDGYSDEDETSNCGSSSDPLDESSLPEDFDSDLICDLLDDDDDNDGYSDSEDSFSKDSSEWSDNDGDGIGDNADQDDDNDGYTDEVDWAPMDGTEWSDNDGDGTGDNADQDDDNDQWSDSDEQSCATDSMDSNSVPLDSDNDLICDLVDSDDDNDGVDDASDAFPLDPNESLDTDRDGIGNNADPDDDNDLLNDVVELSMGTDPLNQDTDGDGYQDSIDDLPLDSSEWRDTDGDGVGDNSDAFPSLARYQTASELILDLVLVGVVIFIGVSLYRGYRFGGGPRDGEDQ
jgi:ABC-type branched-subunit amino acid transport system substrate-binding protein